MEGDAPTTFAPAGNGDHTRLAGGLEDHTRLASGPDADHTRLSSAPDADHTRLASAPDADHTRLADAPHPPADEQTRIAEGAAAGLNAGPLRIGDAFGRYTVMRLLGVGGMGAVYQAWDKELDVVVALKVIRPEAVRDPAAEQEIERRFKRELLLARQVTHKNVVRIHDLGEVGGIKYITMTYVHGTDLSTLIKRKGKLPLPQVLKTMRAVLDGLVAAHTAGVVHRDLKPANIMIDAEGEALIMDFGIARSTLSPTEGSKPAAGAALPDALKAMGSGTGSASGSGTGQSKYTEATVLGTVVGTVEYMAPEQALGQAVDQRADVYATGLMLYDLLTGKRRSEGPGTALERLRARMEKPMPTIKGLAPDIHDALAAIVTRAIELDPAKRYQTTAEFAEDLARLDEQGVPLPIKRSVSIRMMGGIVAAVVALTAGALYYFRPVPDKPHAPVSVVIADIENRTNEPTFDRTLEPMLKRALEGASFITAFDRVGLRRTVGTALPAKLDEAAALDLAAKQGLGLVLSGAIEKQGSRYAISLKVTDKETRQEVTTATGKASDKDQVIAKMTDLVASVRKDLGDRTSTKDQLLAMTSLSTSSLEVIKYYGAAQEAASNNKLQEAREQLLKAVSLDPNFGAGYLVLAGISRNMQQFADAEKYITEAMKHLDNMTERERYTTRGMLFRITGDYSQCVKQHEELIKNYAGDVIGHNQLALCASQLRKLDQARDEMQFVVNMLPGRPIFRDNLSLYSSYGGDFARGEQEARKVKETAPTDPFSSLALAFAQMGNGQLTDAANSFKDLARTEKDKDGKDQLVYGPLGPTLSASGLGDIAVHEGRFADAVRILEQGAAADLPANLADRAAAKYAAVAYAQLSRGQKAAAVAAAEKALANSKAVKIRFLAARTFIDAGQSAKAAPLMKGLAAEVLPEPQAYAKMIEAQIAMMGKDAQPAVKLLTEANDLFDTWLGHFELGRAYLATQQFPQADSEIDKCLTRRSGEALSLFLDEEPTYGYFPMVLYFQGRVKEGLKLQAGANDSYRKYLSIREKAGEDPLVSEVKKRIK